MVLSVKNSLLETPGTDEQDGLAGWSDLPVTDGFCVEPLLYLKPRYYSPDTGQFNQLDPFFGDLGDPLSLHKYAYVHGDPVNSIDPSGEAIFTLAGLGWLLSVSALAVVAYASWLWGTHEVIEIHLDADYKNMRRKLEGNLINVSRNRSTKVRQEAKAISEAIVRMLERRAGTKPRLPGTETHKGYYCFQWAYGFENAFNDVDPKNFEAKVEHASTAQSPTGDTPVHYWLRITPTGGGDPVYVDDGFAVVQPRRTFIHRSRPVPRGYYFPAPDPGVPSSTVTPTPHFAGCWE